jgi:hypothetical protein
VAFGATLGTKGPEMASLGGAFGVGAGGAAAGSGVGGAEGMGGLEGGACCAGG